MPAPAAARRPPRRSAWRPCSHSPRDRRPARLEGGPKRGSYNRGHVPGARNGSGVRLTRGAARAGLGVAAALAGALLGASPAHGANEVGDPTGPVSIAMIVPVTVPV